MGEKYTVALVIPTVDLGEVGLEVGNNRIVLVRSIAIGCNAINGLVSKWQLLAHILTTC